jgi:hypothetical protein
MGVDVSDESLGRLAGSFLGICLMKFHFMVGMGKKGLGTCGKEPLCIVALVAAREMTAHSQKNRQCLQENVACSCYNFFLEVLGLSLLNKPSQSMVICLC